MALTNSIHFDSGAFSTRPRKGASLPPSSLDIEPDSNRNKANSKLRNILFPDTDDGKSPHAGFAGLRRWISDSFPARRHSARHVLEKHRDNSANKEALAFEVRDQDNYDHVGECVQIFYHMMLYHIL